jgi:hypothetical protein
MRALPLEDQIDPVHTLTKTIIVSMALRSNGIFRGSHLWEAGGS